ncbi:STM4504/CBY_0614 family protein [Nitrosospira multiformis]|nr:hypothetical protein [Nitrosospira multiformis]
MSVIDLFSHRQKELRGEVPDVYVYDDLPRPLRVQIVHILRRTLGDEKYFRQESSNVRDAYTAIVDILCREYGVFNLAPSSYHGEREHISEFFNFILDEFDCEKVLDGVELAFRLINKVVRDYEYLSREDASEIADDALRELNIRLKRHGVGYSFEGDEIIRVDSEFVHAEVVKPALTLLCAPEFKGAEAEFLKAHEHYRHGRAKEALTECLKSLESTMKSICAKRSWAHDPNATSSALINLLFQKELIPSFWSNHFSGLRAILEGGVPPARNKLGGHGQGVEIRDVPLHLVAFALHQTAAAIVFLVKSEEDFSPA